MKKYIKPNTEVYAVELQKMIAESNRTLQVKGDSYTEGGGITLGGKDNSLPSSNGLWDEEE